MLKEENGKSNSWSLSKNKELAQKKIDCNVLKGEKDELNSQLLITNKECSRYKEENDELNSQLLIKDKELDNMKTDYNMLKKENDELCSQLLIKDNICKDLEEVHGKYIEKEAKLNSQVSSCTADVICSCIFKLAIC